MKPEEWEQAAMEYLKGEVDRLRREVLRLKFELDAAQDMLDELNVEGTVTP